MPSVSKLIMTEVEMEGQARPKTPISATHNGRRKQARLKSTSLPTPSARYVCMYPGILQELMSKSSRSATGDCKFMVTTNRGAAACFSYFCCSKDSDP